MAEQRTFLGESPEQRRNRRRKVLIEAALDLVYEGGLPAVGVRSVSQQANLSTRYFYENFSGVDDLLIQMLRQLFEETMMPGLVAIHSFDLRRTRSLTDEEILTLLSNGLNASLGSLFSDPRKVAMIAAANSDSGSVRQEFKRLIAMLVDLIGKDPAARDLGVDPLAASFISAGLVESMVAFVSGELKMSKKTLVKRVALMILRIVKGK